MSWLFPEGKAIKTVFYQGLNSSQNQLAKYTGDDGFISTDGEVIKCKNSINVICNPHIGCELNDVEQFKWTINPFKLFMYFVTYLIGIYYGIYPVRPHAPIISLMSVGQTNDINNHLKRCNLLDDAEDKILYGVSRGSATTFNAFAAHHYKGVRLVVLEGVFYDAQEVLLYRYGRFAKIVTWLLETFTSYRSNGISPGKMVEQFPENVPVIFITSRIDTAVPMSTTLKLVNALAARGRNIIHVITLNNSRHPFYMCDDDADSNMYQNVMHHYYRQYGLPYIEEYANKWCDQKE